MVLLTLVYIIVAVIPSVSLHLLFFDPYPWRKQTFFKPNLRFQETDLSVPQPHSRTKSLSTLFSCTTLLSLTATTLSLIYTPLFVSNPFSASPVPSSQAYTSNRKHRHTIQTWTCLLATSPSSFNTQARSLYLPPLPRDLSTEMVPRGFSKACTESRVSYILTVTLGSVLFLATVVSILNWVVERGIQRARRRRYEGLGISSASYLSGTSSSAGGSEIEKKESIPTELDSKTGMHENDGLAVHV